MNSDMKRVLLLLIFAVNNVAVTSYIFETPEVARQDIGTDAVRDERADPLGDRAEFLFDGPSGEGPSEASGVSPPDDDEVIVTCGQNEMSISIPKSVLNGLDVEHIRLTNESCGATENPARDRYILETDLTACGTTKSHIEDFVTYMNTVEEIPVEDDQIITRVREVEIPFTCAYSDTGVVSAVGLQVESKKIVFSEKGLGEFVLEMNIFPDDSYERQYTKRDFPVTVPLRKILFVQVSVDTEDSRLAILAETCFATPDANPNKPGLKYVFINDGCSEDDTLERRQSNDKRRERFSLEAFKFLGNNPFVYMHCKVKVCDADDPNSRCAQGCLRNSRRRRSLYTQETNDEEYLLAQGPFMRGAEKSDETESQVDIELHEIENSSQFTPLVAAMAVFAAVCVIGVSYFAWNLKRKRGVVRSYQLLSTTPDE